VDRIGRLLPADAAAITVYSGNLTSVAARGRVLDGTPAVLYPRDRARDATLTYFSPGLLLDGSMGSSGSAGIDSITAARLGLGIGDFLSYRQKVDADSAHDLRGSVKITAVFAPTSSGSGVVLPLSADLAKALAGPEGIVGSDLFIRTGSASVGDVTRKLATLQGAENWNVNVVADQLTHARKEVDATASRAVRVSMVFGALLISTVYVLRDQFSRVERRRRDVAIMISLGEPIRRISAIFVAEQVTLAVAGTILGVWLAGFVLRTYLHLYVPGDSAFLLGGLAIGVNVTIAIVTALHLRRRVARMPVARILASE
jgi:hypothetical protein